ncbi:MAG: Na+/H+ antiporter NhaC family protein [bacterium]
MQGSWLVLVPPILVVVCAAVTRRVVLSLLLGIFSSLFIVHDFSLFKTIPAMVSKIWQTTELGTVTSWHAFWQTWYLFICLFLILLGIITVMLQHSGGAYAYGNFISSRLKNAKQAQASSLILSLFFFIDDYFSCLTVGSVMRPITDRFRIPRVKLALLVNSMAAPLVVLLPISSWAAYIIMQIHQSGVFPTDQKGTVVIADPFFVYTGMIPFLFYSIIAIFSLWFLVLRNISYGILGRQEQIAADTGNLFGGKGPAVRQMMDVSADVIQRSSVWDFIVPIMILFIAVATSILYFGGYHLLGGTHDLGYALRHSNSAQALFVGSVVTLLISFPFLIARKMLAVRQIPRICLNGIRLLGPSTMILILIWTLSSLLKNDLQTGQYLAQILVGKVDIALLPVMFFFVAALTASTMGSAWGTIGIHVPIAVPLLVSLAHIQTPVTPSGISMLFPLLGAIISGAVVGNHLAPISDTMLMSSTSSGAYHIDLVKTQYGFTIPTVISTATAFLIAGFLTGVVSSTGTIIISLLVGLMLNWTILSILSLRKK